jgi:site-specific DNA recombinase
MPIFPVDLMTTEPRRKAVLYARVSSKDQEKDGFSIPAQRRLLREYVHEHRLSVLKEFVDVETAKEAGRRSFGEMLAFLRDNRACRVLLVEKTDRLYRNLKDWVHVDAQHPGLSSTWLRRCHLL